MTHTYWAPAAWTGTEWVTGLEFEVDAGTVTSSARTSRPSPAASRLDGPVLPGLVNTHSHAFHRALRGRVHGPGDFWGWRRDMYAVASALDPDRYELLATAVFGEMVAAGITMVGEFHYLHRGPDGVAYSQPNEMGQALVRAANAAGIRLCLIDACYLASDADGSPPEGAQLRFSDGSSEAWTERHAALTAALAQSPNVTVAAAVHSIRAVPSADLPTVAAGAGDQPLHVHVSEQAAENERCIELYGQTPTELLYEHGVLGPGTTAVHATHLEAGDIARLATTGTGVCMCPTTERDLGDGLGPAIELAKAGVELSVGTDSHAQLDMFEEIRGVEMNDRARLRRRGLHSPSDLVAAATGNGAAALGQNVWGIIAGAPADFVVVDDASVRTAGGEGIDAMLFTATSADVRETYVGGEQVWGNGEHASLGGLAFLLEEAVRSVAP